MRRRTSRGDKEKEKKEEEGEERRRFASSAGDLHPNVSSSVSSEL